MAKSEIKVSKEAPAPTLQARRLASMHWGVSPIRSSAPPVTIVGSSRSYRGGYCVNV
jgi:hypothetical protein